MPPDVRYLLALVDDADVRADVAWYRRLFERAKGLVLFVWLRGDFTS